MSSRLAEKERRRAEREDQERRLAIQRQRRRTGGLVAGAVFLLLAGAGVLAVVLSSSGAGGRSSAATSTGSFGPHYAGLVARRQGVGVPTMMQTMSSSAHFHPRLKVLVDGKQIPVPANIGIDPSQDSMQMAGLHTHDDSGTIHVEGVEHATLGQFFQIWGVPMSASQLGPYHSAGPQTVRMWVNGKPSSTFGSLRLADGQRIVVSYGPATTPPAA